MRGKQDIHLISDCKTRLHKYPENILIMKSYLINIESTWVLRLLDVIFEINNWLEFLLVSPSYKNRKIMNTD